jgi:hypothetical protein
VTVDEERLREAVRYAEAAIRLVEYGSGDWFFWRGWRAAMLTELERVTRPEMPPIMPPAPVESTSLRIVR